MRGAHQRLYLVLVGGELRLQRGDDHLSLLHQILGDLHSVFRLLRGLLEADEEAAPGQVGEQIHVV